VDIIGTAAKLANLASRVGEEVGEIISNDELQSRIDRITTQLGPYGVDPFGFDPQYVKKFISLVTWIYRNYFRAETHGASNIPDGRCFIVSNHSGQLPYDAAMITVAGFIEREPPVFARSMIERFVPSLPFVSPFLARCGQLLGTPENCRRLLENEGAILVFPEGVRGLNKPWSQRYRLQEFGQGFLRLAIEKAAPVVPCVVIGAEEQAPTIGNAKSIAGLFGLPSLPITMSPGFGLLPLPTKYRIFFGEPIFFDGDANDEDEVIMRKVEQVRGTMQKMIDEGLARREHVFW